MIIRNIFFLKFLLNYKMHINHMKCMTCTKYDIFISLYKTIHFSPCRNLHGYQTYLLVSYRVRINIYLVYVFFLPAMSRVGTYVFVRILHVRRGQQYNIMRDEITRQHTHTHIRFRLLDTRIYTYELYNGCFFSVNYIMDHIFL